VTPQESFAPFESFEDRLTGALLEIAAKDERLRHYEDENARLREIIAKFKRELFGPRKERWVSEEQLVMLFNEAEVEATKPELEEDADLGETTVESHKRKRGKRKPLPEHLLREVVVIDLQDSEKMDINGQPITLRVVGKEISEKLEYMPASLKVLEIQRLKYEAVSPESGESTIMTAKPEPTIVPKGIVTPSLLAGITVNKYADGLPLYRQEEIFARLGINLPRSSQGRWIIAAFKQCQPIWNVLEDRLMRSLYVACDETWTQVLKEKGRKAERDSWMWLRATPSDREKIVLFDYDPHRSGAVAQRLFADYKGILQVDGYGAYNILEKQEGLIRIGCNMHGRRKFSDAHTVGAKQGQSLAEVALKFYKDLYDLEERAKELSWEERHELRQKEATPIWAKFKAWAEANSRKVPPKSKIGEAFHYFLNEYDYLIGYLRDGRLEMDNGFAERAIKYFAIGRNNWLFSDTEAGAEASSLFYSFVVTAKLNGVNPLHALTRIFKEVPKAKTIEDYERLADLLVTRPPPS
jgi:transposase